MKARIPAKHKITNAQKEFIKEFMESREEETTRRMLKLVCAGLNQEFGFGKERLQRFLNQLDLMSLDEIVWWHVDKLVIDQIGLNFEREKDG
ncbi:MAG: hypothetical protein ACOYBL_13885 [Lachnospiraceae bacterium]